MKDCDTGMEYVISYICGICDQLYPDDINEDILQFISMNSSDFF